VRHPVHKRAHVAAALVSIVCAAAFASISLPAQAITARAAVLPTAVQSTAPAVTADDGDTLTPGAQPDLSTATSDTTLNADGTYTTTVYKDPVNYQDGNGDWAPIDNTLVDAPGSTYAVENAANEYTVSIPEDPAATPIKFETDDAWLTMKMSGSDDIAPDVNDDTAVVDVSKTASVEYQAQNTGLKETINLDSPPSAPLSYRYTLTVSAGITPALDASGDIAFRDGAGQTKFVIPAATMADSAAAPAFSAAISYGLAQSGSTWTLTLTPDQAWLTDPSRVYPVAIDPSVTTYWDAADCWIRSDMVNTSNCDHNTYIYAGHANGLSTHGLLNFGLGGVPTSAIISSATLSLYLDGSQSVGNGGGYWFSLYQPNAWWQNGATWSHTGNTNGSTWTNGGSSGATLSASPVYLGSNTASGWVAWDITHTYKGWQDTTIPTRGVLVRSDDETHSRQLGFWSDDTYGRPYVTVNYTLPTPPYTPNSIGITPTSGGFVTSLTPTLTTVVSDPDGGMVHADFYAYDDDGVMVMALPSQPVANGGTASLSVPGGVLNDGGSYDFYVYANDGSAASAGSAAVSVDVDTGGAAVTQAKQNAQNSGVGQTVVASQLQFAPDQYIAATADSGNAQAIADVKSSVVALLNADIQIGAMPQTTQSARQSAVASRTLSPGEQGASTPNVTDQAQAAWATSAAQTQVSDWSSALTKEAADPTYRPYDTAHFNANQWQGVIVAPSGQTASAMVMGNYSYCWQGVCETGDDGQYTIGLTLNPTPNSLGNWQLTSMSDVLAANVVDLSTVTSSSGPSTNSSYTYDGAAAAAYAKKYSCNAKDSTGIVKSCRNQSYKDFPEDCTNFVSQAVLAGGQPFFSGYLPSDYTTLETWKPYTSDWVRVNWFATFESESGRAHIVSIPDQSVAYTPAWKGDVFMYDFGDGRGFAHLTMETGWGHYRSRVDPITGANTSTANGGSGDKISGHSNDRDGFPWNWGYLNQRNPKWRAKSSTYIIEMN